MKKQKFSAPRFCHATSALTLVGVFAAHLLGGSNSVSATTLGYWRFEGDGVTAPTDAAFLQETNGRTAVQPGLTVLDSSGNGNDLYTWNNDATGHVYDDDLVPAAVIPQTSASNSFSIQNFGAFPASFTWSRESVPSLDIEPLKLEEWTIEASIYATDNTGHRTFVGRDGNQVSSTDASAAPLYFKSFNGTLRIEFADEAGNFYSLADTTGAMSLNTWYNVAAVSDGLTLSLYRDSGAGYSLVGSTLLTGADTRLAYDDAGSSTSGDTQWGWTVGRGRYGTNNAQDQNHGDRWFGSLDEVRISDAALAPNQFLFTVPEPSTFAMLIGGFGMLLGFQRSRRCRA